MHDIGNPVEKAWSASLEIDEFPQTFVNFDRKPFKVLQNSGIPQDSQPVRFGVLQKLLLSFLAILKVFSTQFSVVHRGVVDIFWNSPLCLASVYKTDFS